MTADEFSNTITRVTAGGSGKDVLDKLNTPLGQIEGHLNKLASRIEGLDNKSAVIRRYVPCSSDVFVGALVYFNSNQNHLRFEPAQALLKAVPGRQGESVEADCARVEGIIIALDSEVSGQTTVFATMLSGGYWESSDVMLGCLGNAVDKPGVYYLSPTSAGHAVQDTNGHLRQPVLSNYGGGKFSMSCGYLAHDNHYHASCTLADGWIPCSEPPAGVTPPKDANYWYNGVGDTAYESLGELSDQITAVFFNGLLQNLETSDFSIADGYLWYNPVVAPQPGSVTLFNHYPFAYNGAFLRSVESTNEALSVENINGAIKLTPNAFVNGTNTNTARAVASINKNIINYTPVVSGVSAGPGIDIKLTSYGIATISSTSQIGVPVDAYNVNHMQTNMTSDGYYLYFTFPKGRQSALVMSSPITGVTTGTKLKAFAWACTATGSASFKISYYWVPQPVVGQTAALSREAVGEAKLSSAGSTSSTSDYTSYTEASGGAIITGNGMLYARMEIENPPANDIKLLRVGFRMEIADASAIKPDHTNITDIKALTNTDIAAVAMPKYTCVVRAADGLRPCRSTEARYSNECLGVLYEDAAAGQECTYMICGALKDSTFNFVAGAAVYIGVSGELTQQDPSANPSAAFIQRVGTALDSGSLQINIEQGVIKK